MKTLAAQVKEFMDWKANHLGKGFGPTEMAAAVAFHQKEIPAASRCKRQNIESLLKKDQKTTLYLVALAQAMGTSAETLQMGRYSPQGLVTNSRLQSPQQAHEAQNIPENSTNEKNNLTIRQFDTGGSMGTGIVLQDQPGVIQSMEVSQEWVQKNIRNFSSVSNLAIVTGFGDSMKPLFNGGDPLLVDRAVKKVKYEAIYFFRVGDEGFVKRLQRIPGQGILVISENTAYRDWTITEDMDFEVFARVVKVWCGEDF